MSESVRYDCAPGGESVLDVKKVRMVNLVVKITSIIVSKFNRSFFIFRRSEFICFVPWYLSFFSETNLIRFDSIAFFRCDEKWSTINSNGVVLCGSWQYDKNKNVDWSYDQTFDITASRCQKPARDWNSPFLSLEVESEKWVDRSQLWQMEESEN